MPAPAGLVGCLSTVKAANPPSIDRRLAGAHVHPMPASRAAETATEHAGFDLIVKDGLSWPAAVLAHILQLTSVNVLPIPLFQPVAAHFMGTPNPLAYVEQGLWGEVPQVQPGVMHQHGPTCCRCAHEPMRATESISGRDAGCMGHLLKCWAHAVHDCRACMPGRAWSPESGLRSS